MKLFTAIFFVLFVCISCNNQQDKKAPNNESEKTTSATKNTAKFSEEAFKRSWSLMEKGQQLANSGGSLEDILKILPDAIIIQKNDASLLFLLEGSTPMLIKFKDASNKNPKNTDSGTLLQQRINPTSLFTGLTTFYSTIEEVNTIVDIVGSQRGETDRQQKKAVLISLYLAEFGTNDDYYVVKDILDRNRNYRGNITVRQNNLTLADFEDLDTFDIVHISTHSEMFCGNIEVLMNDGVATYTVKDESCRTILYPNIKHGFENSEEAFNFLNTNKYRDLLGFSVEEFYLRSTFFEHFYSGKLTNKIWFFSSCEIGELSDMTSTMNSIHENGHFLYWTNSVESDDAQKASKEFYKNLVEKGLNATNAHRLIPEKLRENLPSDTLMLGDKQLMTYVSNLELINTGVHQHGIEVVEMLHPETSQTLKTGDLYPVTGDFGDGRDEIISLKVKLLGYTKAEFETQQMRLSLKLDDETILNKIQFLPNQEEGSIIVRDIPGNEYGIEVEIKDIEIDDLGDKTEVTLTSYLHFDDTYFSIHSEKVKVRAQGILAIINDGKQLAKFYYDHVANAVRVETEDSPNHSYMNKEGYFYFYNDSEGIPLGWVKSKAMASMFTGNFSFTAATGNKHINNDSGTFKFPIIAWAQNHRMRDYEQNTNFKQHVINCGDNKMCTKFSGIAGQEKGHYAIFNPSSKLIEMGQEQVTIKFKYGSYKVKLPIAEEISIPSFN